MPNPPLRLPAPLLSVLILALFIGSTPGNLAADQPQRFTLTGTSELWWLESGHDHFGPHPIRGHHSINGSNRHSSVIALGRSRPVEDVAIYSTDGVDSMVISARPEFREGALAFTPNHVSGVGFITAGVMPAHTDPTIPVEDIQLIALALGLLNTNPSEAVLRRETARLNLVKNCPLLPEAGLPVSAYRIRKFEVAPNHIETWIQVIYPGGGMHRTDKYEYIYPGPFRESGYVGYSLRITAALGAHGTLRIESTNHVPAQSVDVPGSAYDIIKPSSVRHIGLELREAVDAVEPTAMAMQQLKLVDVNDYRPGGDLLRKSGIQLTHMNQWPARGTREFAETSEAHARKEGSGRKFRWIFGGAILLIGAGWISFHFRRTRQP